MEAWRAARTLGCSDEGPPLPCRVWGGCRTPQGDTGGAPRKPQLQVTAPSRSALQVGTEVGGSLGSPAPWGGGCPQTGAGDSLRLFLVFLDPPPPGAAHAPDRLGREGWRELGAAERAQGRTGQPVTLPEFKLVLGSLFPKALITMKVATQEAGEAGAGGGVLGDPRWGGSPASLF